MKTDSTPKKKKEDDIDFENYTPSEEEKAWYTILWGRDWDEDFPSKETSKK